MYSDTSWLGRMGFDDNPTAAIVLHFFRISWIASTPRVAANSEPSGTSTLIVLSSSSRRALCGNSLFPYFRGAYGAGFHHARVTESLLLERVANSPFPARFINT